MTARRGQPIATTDLVAIILSVSMGLALNLFIVIAGMEAIGVVSLPIGLSDNATQVLAAWGGGIIGIIGALVGVRVGRKQATPASITVEERTDL